MSSLNTKVHKTKRKNTIQSKEFKRRILSALKNKIQ
jgi:hypothetical protein